MNSEAIAPFYASELTTVYCGDVRGILDAIPENSIDLIVTDPPYHMAKYLQDVASGTLPHTVQHELEWIVSVCRMYAGWVPRLKRLCPKGPALFFMGWEHLGLFTRMLAMEGWPVQDVWAHPPYEALVLVGSWRLGDDDSAQVQRYLRKHGSPHRKDPWMVGELLKAIGAKPGRVVLDPFCGGGSTLVAAKRLGCHAIGIDHHEDQCAATVAALESEEGK